MNTYRPKHIVMLMLPLLGLLTSCGLPGDDNASTETATVTPIVVSYSATPTATFVTQTPTEIIFSTFTSTSTPTAMPTSTPTSTPTPTETAQLLPTPSNTPNPQTVAQEDQNSPNGSPLPESSTSEPSPDTGSEAEPDTAPATENSPLFEVFVMPDPPQEAGQKTPTPECIACSTD